MARAINIGKSGQIAADLDRGQRYFDDTYRDSRVGFMFFSQINVDWLHRQFRRKFAEKYGRDPGRQEEFFILERMHEAYWDMFDIHYHQMRARKGALMTRFLLADHHFSPADNEDRGIINKPYYNKMYRDYDPFSRKNADHPKRPIIDILRQLNAATLDDLLDIAGKKYATWINYARHYNMSVHEKLSPTWHNRLPENTGFAYDRRPAAWNPVRVKPRTYEEDSHMYADLHRPL